MIKKQKKPGDTKYEDVLQGTGRILMLGLAGFMALRFGTKFDMFVAEVFHTARDTKEFMQKGGIVRDEATGKPKVYDTGAPHRYENGSPFKGDMITRVHEDMLRAFCNTSTDPKAVDSERDVFRFSVRDMVAVAEIFKDVLDKGYIEDLRPPDVIGYSPERRIYVDLSRLEFSGMPIRELISVILDNRTYFETYDRYGTWREASRYIGLRSPAGRAPRSVMANITGPNDGRTPKPPRNRRASNDPGTSPTTRAGTGVPQATTGTNPLILAAG
jgi:hypothetical protein